MKKQFSITFDIKNIEKLDNLKQKLNIEKTSLLLDLILTALTEEQILSSISLYTKSLIKKETEVNKVKNDDSNNS